MIRRGACTTNRSCLFMALPGAEIGLCQLRCTVALTPSTGHITFLWCPLVGRYLTLVWSCTAGHEDNVDRADNLEEPCNPNESKPGIREKIFFWRNRELFSHQACCLRCAHTWVSWLGYPPTYWMRVVRGEDAWEKMGEGPVADWGLEKVTCLCLPERCSPSGEKNAVSGRRQGL